METGAASADKGYRFLIAVAWRVCVLYLVFNLVYYAVQPLDQGWTIYNRIIPGRLRFAYALPGQDWYVSNETRLARLMADHVCARPKPDNEFRIVVLGSSETWGMLNRPEEVMAQQLNNLDLKTPDGRRITSCNYAYVWPDTFKDLIILHAALASPKSRPDLVLLALNSYAFDPTMPIHWLAAANPDQAAALTGAYNLHIPFEDVEKALQTPAWQRRTFIYQRSDAAAWLTAQAAGLTWALSGLDQDLRWDGARVDQVNAPVEWKNNRPGLLEAIQSEARRYNIPVILVSVPVNYQAPDFNTWLAGESRRLDLPLLDSSQLLPPRQFTNTKLHIDSEGHLIFARQVGSWLKETILPGSGK